MGRDMDRIKFSNRNIALGSTKYVDTGNSAKSGRVGE